MKKISQKNVEFLKKIMSKNQKEEVSLLKGIFDKKIHSRKNSGMNENENEAWNHQDAETAISFSSKLMNYLPEDTRKSALLAISTLNDGPENTGDEVFGECIMILKDAFQKINDLVYTRDDGADENMNEKHL